MTPPGRQICLLLGLGALGALTYAHSADSQGHPTYRWKQLGGPNKATDQLDGTMKTVPLPVGIEVAGVRRYAPRLGRSNMDADDPTVAVATSGEVLLAWVDRQRGTERLFLKAAGGPKRPLGAPRPVSPGPRAWHPRLAAGLDGSVWLAWCGRHESPTTGDLRRDVFLRRVRPQLGPIQQVSDRVDIGDAGRHCDPDLAVARDGTVHLAWELSNTTRPFSVRIAYRRLEPSGLLSPIEVVSKGPFDRRPSVLFEGQTVTVAWDALVSTQPDGALDPDYDVLLRQQTAGAWGDLVAVDDSPGIQAAARLQAAFGGGVLVAYHSSLGHPMVKWWRVRRVRHGQVEQLVPSDPSERFVGRGEQQGAELPDIALRPDGRIIIATRASQGAYLHLVDGAGISPPLDLTRRGWGARGVRLDLTVANDGSVLLARRARHEVILERFTLDLPAATETRFEPVGGRSKAPAPPLAKETPKAFGRHRILYGDVHMHSAMSDGTGPPDEIIARAWARGMDFAALTDHDQVAGARMALSEHDEMVWLSEVFDGLEGFTTLNAFEWTTPSLPEGFGHRNVYFRGSVPTPVYGAADGFGGTRRLNRALRNERAFTAPHHAGWTGTDWHNFDPTIQRHFEIVSVHGVFEDLQLQPLPPRGERPSGFATAGLARGHRFGFLGGSDAHGLLWHHGVGRRQDPWGHGLTGVLAPVNERTALWDALYARRTFATSGVRMQLLVNVGRAVQGETTFSETPEITWQVKGTLPIEELTVIRDGQEVHRLTQLGPEHGATWRDPEPQPGEHSYYLRAIQGKGRQNMDIAWSSPVFVTVPKPDERGSARP